MAWNVIRRATSADTYALEKAARRFADRHPELQRAPLFDANQRTNGWTSAVNDAIYLMSDYSSINDIDEGKYLARLWLRCVRRALRDPRTEGIWREVVGYNDED